MTNFADFGLIEPIFRAISEHGYTQPTPIQAAAIPPLMAGRDVLGIAQTGTGKTAAFALPMLHCLATNGRRPAPRAMRALILTPTRELACQIADDMAAYGTHLKLRCVVIHGGVSQNPQVNALRNGIDIVIATPGRLLDLMQQRLIDLKHVETFVLDEADRMLDMGFIRDVKTIVAALPKDRQSLMFSATMPQDIVSLVDKLLRDFTRIAITPPATTVERIDQKIMFVLHDNKRKLLDHVLADADVSRAIVFSRTKHGANRVAEQLKKSGIHAEAIHGNKSQNARQKALDAFKAGSLRVLVATDIAARGIDVTGITHVINFDLPVEPESYVHRIGRTARASASGAAISFCTPEESSQLRAIEREIRRSLPVDSDHPYHAEQGQRRATGAGERQTANRGAQPKRDDASRRRHRGRRSGGGFPKAQAA